MAATDAHLTALYYADAYPPNAPVLDQNRVVQMGVHAAYTADQSQPMNFYPACLKADSAAVAWLADKPIRTKTHMPDCPPELFANGKAMWHDHPSDAEIQPMIDNINRWSLRGAIAAGMSVFTYLEHVFQSNGTLNIVNPAYNECQLLP